MNLSNLHPAKGSVKNRKRIGRGEGSGRGGTSTKGNKGAQSRSGYSSKSGFEGGQMPYQRRLPKFGFKNPFRIEYKAINLSKIDELAQKLNITYIDKDVLVNNQLLSKNESFKVLAKGTISSKLEIVANGFSKKAIEYIENACGKYSIK